MLKRKWSEWFKRQGWKGNGLPCFYCNADSDELKFFLILFIGGLCFGAVCVGVGLFLAGKFKSTENLADLPLKIQQNEFETKRENHE